MIKSKIKTIVMVVAILLCLALAGGWIAQTVVNKQKQEAPVITETVSNFTVTPESNKFMRLTAKPLTAEQYEDYGIMPIAQSAYTVTATITPSNADDKTVDWSVAWKDGNSTWAKGKTVTNYVTVTPTSDGALTASVSCLAAFGEQIIVTVVPRANTDISATCTLDYRQTITGVVSELSHYIYGGSAADDKNRIATAATGGTKTVNLAPSTYASNFYQRYYTLSLSSTYTLPINTVDITYKLTLTNNFRTALSSQGCSPASTSGATFDTVSNATIGSNKQVTMSFANSGSTGKGCADYYGLLCTGLASSSSGSGATKFNADTYNKFIAAAKTVSSGGHFTITITATGRTSAGDNTTFTATTLVTLSNTSLLVAPTGVSTNQSSLVF